MELSGWLSVLSLTIFFSSFFLLFVVVSCFSSSSCVVVVVVSNFLPFLPPPPHPLAPRFIYFFLLHLPPTPFHPSSVSFSSHLYRLLFNFSRLPRVFPPGYRLLVPLQSCRTCKQFNTALPRACVHVATKTHKFGVYTRLKQHETHAYLTQHRFACICMPPLLAESATLS